MRKTIIYIVILATFSGCNKDKNSINIININKYKYKSEDTIVIVGRSPNEGFWYSDVVQGANFTTNEAVNKQKVEGFYFDSDKSRESFMAYKVMPGMYHIKAIDIGQYCDVGCATVIMPLVVTAFIGLTVVTGGQTLVPSHSAKRIPIHKKNEDQALANLTFTANQGEVIYIGDAFPKKVETEYAKHVNERINEGSRPQTAVQKTSKNGKLTVAEKVKTHKLQFLDNTEKMKKWLEKENRELASKVETRICK